MKKEFWDSCEDIELLLAAVADTATEQQLRSLCIGCCRDVWEHLPPLARNALEVAEQFGNNKASELELQLLNDLLGDLCEQNDGFDSAATSFAAIAAFHASMVNLQVDDVTDCCRNAESAGQSTLNQIALLKSIFSGPES